MNAEGHMREPLLSVLMPTYNHGRFISEALEGCLQQKTNFPFQIVVCDDCSTDTTREIIDSYAAKHTQIVRSYQPRNSKGTNNYLDGLARISTKYIAFCEGDDYWTDPTKLQQQVDFLEANPLFTVCTHKVKILYDEGVPHNAGEYVYKDLDSPNERIRNGVFFPDEAINNYYFQTSSFVFRWKFPNGLPGWFTKGMCFDHFLFLLHAADGLIKYFDMPMSCWRHHENGYTYLQNIDKNLFFAIKSFDWISIYSQINAFFDNRFAAQIRERVLLSHINTIEYCLKYEDYDQLRDILTREDSFFKLRLQRNRILQTAWDTIYPEEGREVHLPWETPATSREEAPKPIGSFKEFALDAVPAVRDSVFSKWVGTAEYACFATVNQAIMAWLYEHAINDLYLPNYYEPLVDILRYKLQIRPYYYECNYNLEPDTALAIRIPSGAAIITCAYFGKPTSVPLQRALARRKDIFWLEDRRHVLWTGQPRRAPWAVYDPTETLGVPDGGILVGPGAAACTRHLSPGTNDAFGTALLQRVEKYEGYPFGIPQRTAFQQNRAQAPLPNRPCSRTTLAMLRRIPLRPLKARIRQNYAILRERLPELAYWATVGNFIPFAFPALFPNTKFPRVDCKIALAVLAQKGIHCSRKWNPILESIYSDSGALELSQKLLLLPCDYRYGDEDMHRIADTIESELEKF